MFAKLIAVFLACAASAGIAQAQLRQTESGPVQGITFGGISEFRGIPYAAPPVGNLRWRPPAAPVAWTGTRDGSMYGPACEQQLASYPVSEDCLTLNIYVPSQTTVTSKLPVMVWIHGGGFISGSGRDFDGSYLAVKGDVIVVSINYRLGYFGFLAHPALSAADPNHVSGNYGILDQQAAFAWVRRNIANFGGDPGRVTIFGESAGGQSVIDQLISPGAGPLAGAIAQSGSYMTNLPTLAAQETAGQTAATTLGCPDQSASCLYALGAAAVNVLNPLTSLGNVSPNVDGVTLPLPPAQALAAGKFQHIPIINGSNHDEYRLFVGLDRFFAHAPAMTAAQYQAKIAGQFGAEAGAVLSDYRVGQYALPDYAYAAVLTDVSFACNTRLLNAQIARYSPVWEYELDDPNAPTASGPVIAGFSYGSAHSSDLSYLFQAYNVPAFHPGGIVLSPAQLKLRGIIQEAWLKLARFGTPDGSAGTSWTAFTDSLPVVRRFVPANGYETLDFYADHHCRFWRATLLGEAGLPPNSVY